MLLLAPVLLLILVALAVLVWQAFRPGFGVPWLTAVGLTLAAWGLLLFLRLHLPFQIILRSWLPLGESADFPNFQLDMVSWPYAFSLASLAAAVVLTASARLIHQTHPRAWAGSLAVAGLGMLAIFAGNPLTLIAAWMAIDLVELVIMLVMVKGDRLSEGVVVAFAARVGGILVLVWAVLLGRAQGVVLTFTQVPPEIGVYLLLAAGLRLGVLPLHLPYIDEIHMRRGLGNMLRLVAPASSLVLLARLPANAVPMGWINPLLAITALAVLYTAIMWLFSSDELNGRPYFLIALAGMSIACVINGRPLASMAWGLALLLSGGMLFLYSARQRSVYFLPVLGLLGLAALPFTPSAAGWQGLWVPPIDILNILFVLAHAALLAGYLRHAFQPGDSLSAMERWVQGMYPFGLVLLVISQWGAGYLNVRSSFSLGTAWVGFISTLLALAGLALYSRAPARLLPEGGGEQWWSIVGGRVGHALAVFFRLDWFYNLFSLAFLGLRRLIQTLTTILEGEAGVLWALVLLALLVSLLRTGGTP